MPFETTNRTANSETKNRVLCDNAHPPLVRTMSIGSSWTKLRVGLRLCTTRTSTWAAPSFYFGLTAGKTAPPGTTTPNHFIGYKMPSGVTWTASGTDSFYIAGTNVLGRCKIENGTETFTGFTVNFDAVYFPRHTYGLNAHFIEIEKTTPTSWTITSFFAKDGKRLCTLQTFKSNLSLASLDTNEFTLRGSGTVTVDETTYGSFDSVCFYFSGATDGFEVTDFVYEQLA